MGVTAGAAPTGANPTASVGLTAVNGVATTFMRSDGAPALSQAIAPTWTQTHTFSVESIHNGGIDLGTSGRFDSNVADAAAASSFLFRPTLAQTSGTDRFIFRVDDSSSNTAFVVKANGTSEFNGNNTTGGLINVGGSNAASFGINFVPNATGAGGTVNGVTNTVIGGYFSARRTNAGTSRSLVGGYFDTIYSNPGAVTETNNWGGWFRAFSSAASANSSYVCTEAGGFKVWGSFTLKNFGTVTNWYGGYLSNSCSATLLPNHVITNAYGLYLEEQTRGATINNGIFLANATAGRKLICMRDQNAWIGSDAAARIDIGSTDFLVQSTNIGFFNVTPVARPSAYTQTYATATKTHANLTAATLTDSTGGTANTTLVAISGTGDDANVNNNFADLAAQVNALLADVTNVKQVVNAMIDDDQSLGLKQ